MSQGDDNYEAAQIAEQVKGDLLTAAQLAKLSTRVTEIKDHLCSCTFIGTAEEVSQQLAAFQLMKGKLDAFNELIDDHNSATDQIAQTQPAA